MFAFIEGTVVVRIAPRTELELENDLSVNAPRVVVAKVNVLDHVDFNVKK